MFEILVRIGVKYREIDDVIILLVGQVKPSKQMLRQLELWVQKKKSTNPLLLQIGVADIVQYVEKYLYELDKSK